MPGQSPIKRDDPAEGARENVNVPIGTDEIPDPDSADRDRAAESNAPETTAEERDRLSQVPRDPGPEPRRTTM